MSSSHCHLHLLGTFTKNVSAASTVDWEVIVTANQGETGAANGTFHICDYTEEMRQPPDSAIERSCPPVEGPVMIDYMMWFANFLVAPVGCTSNCERVGLC